MRAIKSLADVQIILKEILDWKDNQISKAKDQRGLQIKNAGDATDPTDFVTLRQLESAFPPGSKVKGTQIITRIVNDNGNGGSGSPGPPGPKGDKGDKGDPGTSAVSNAAEEIPSGTLNSTNKNFTLVHIPITNTLILQLNGVTQQINSDFVLSGSTITYIAPPKATDWHVAQYFY